MPDGVFPPSLPVVPTDAPLSASLDALFGELTCCGRTPTTHDIHRCLSEARLDLADVLPHAACHRDAYVRTLVKKTPTFECLVMCWMPGQRSPVHDHGGATCGVRVIQGSATETTYALAADGYADPVRRRVFHAGDVLTASTDDLHTLGNLPSSAKAFRPVALVTLHVYAPELKGSRKFLERPPRAARPSRRASSRPTVVIVGGGAAGALAAIHLAPAGSSLSVVLVERASRAGRGVAYGTGCRAHLLNVPASRMSAFPDDPEHFLRWARARLGSQLSPHAFVPRAFYGDYLAGLLDERSSSSRIHAVERVHGSVRSVTEGERPRVELADGSSIGADYVIFATGHAPPRDPPVPQGTAFYGGARYTRDPWAPGALEGIRPDADVLLLGTGLTMFDVALALRWRGHFGVLHALSRHGVWPRAHEGSPTRPAPMLGEDDWAALPRRVLPLLRAVRATCAVSPWRSVVDYLRPVTPRLWERLDLRERRRFLEHVRPYWDAHRHRAAAVVHDEIARLVDAGSLVGHVGRLRAWDEGPDGVTAVLAQGEIRAHHVINCTGPDGDVRRSTDPLVQSLLERGLIVRDPLGLGVITAANGALVSSAGRASARLFTLGTWRKAALWESTAIPEIGAQASALAEEIARSARAGREGVTVAAALDEPRTANARRREAAQCTVRAPSSATQASS